MTESNAAVSGDHETNKVDYWVRLEIALDHPVEKVWPYVLHWDRWVSEEDFREYRIGGQLDTEGEIKKVVHFDDTGRMDMTFLAEVVKIIPLNKQKLSD